MKRKIKTETQLKNETWSYYMKYMNLASHKGLDLHHKDPNLKHTNPKRYHEWRIEDVEPLTRADHRKIHMGEQTKGKKHSKSHNKKISTSLKDFYSTKKKIRIFREADVQEFKTLSEAAKHLECSRQLVS